MVQTSGTVSYTAAGFSGSLDERDMQRIVSAPKQLHGNERAADTAAHKDDTMWFLSNAHGD